MARSPQSAATATSESESGDSDSGSSDASEGGLRQWLKEQLFPDIVWGEPSVLCCLQNMQNVAFGLWILCVFSLVCFVIGWLPPENAWLSTESLLLGATAAGSICVIGRDPCFLQSLRDSVALLTFENKRLENSNVKLKTNLEGLKDVDEKFETVHRQLNGEVDAAVELLQALEHHSRVQDVVSALNLFFVSDYENTGSLQPAEAAIFLEGFSQLWLLLPDYDKEDLKDLNSELTFEDFSELLRAVLEDDAKKCRRILDSLCCVAPPDDITYALPPIRKQGSDLESGSEESSADEYEVQPWVTLGPLQIWSPLHLFAMLLMLAALVFLLWDMLLFDFFASTIAILMLILGGGLALQGQLLVIARRLREEVCKYQEENETLRESVEELAGRVKHLQSIERGIETLHRKFNGSVQSARRQAHRGAAQSKTHLVSITLQLFQQADEDSNGLLEAEEIDNFRKTFTDVCAHIPGADMRKIQHVLSTDGFTRKEVHNLVSEVVQVTPPPAVRANAAHVMLQARA